MNTPWVESPFFESILRSRSLSAEEERCARQYHDLGYLVLEGLVDDDEAARIVAETDKIYTNEKDGPRSYYRVQDGFRESPAVARLASHPRVLAVLQLLYGRRPFPFQTLNFRHGSQQAGHSDQIHFSSLPPRYMCGVWVALEDVTEENGPLFYYPGSHRLPECDLYDINLSVERPDYGEYERFVAALMKEKGLRKESLLAKRGTGLIWSSNIVHGGSAIARAGATRYSQVTHYYFDDITDIRTGNKVRQTYNGRPFSAIPLAGGRKFVALGGEPGSVGAAAHFGEVQELLNSRSYKLGRLMTSPYRWLRARLRGPLQKIRSGLR
jgi:ectoine hydroxylase-related dioxygenase (phytanoyl-CoA dioxygenase family)